MSEMDVFLNGVVGVVEATRYEQHCLWRENTRLTQPMPWKSNTHGLMETVGYVNKMPVCISLFTAEISNYKILFLEATSQVVDYRMIDAWLKATMPATALRKDGCVNRTDAMNFYNIFPVRV